MDWLAIKISLLFFFPFYVKKYLIWRVEKTRLIWDGNSCILFYSVAHLWMPVEETSMANIIEPLVSAGDSTTPIQRSVQKLPQCYRQGGYIFNTTHRHFSCRHRYRFKKRTKPNSFFTPVGLHSTSSSSYSSCSQRENKCETKTQRQIFFWTRMSELHSVFYTLASVQLLIFWVIRAFPYCVCSGPWYFLWLALP